MIMRCVWFLCLPLVLSFKTAAGTLTGSFSPVPRTSVVNLSEVGVVDWVHWGLHTATSVNRKAGVTPRISNFSVLINEDNTNAFAAAYQYADNYNGYTWSDGTPEPSVTNTTTGVWCYGIPNIGTGFELTAPADTTVRTLKIYVGAFASRGHFEAVLSDASAPGYTNTSLANMMGNGPGGVYSVEYSADSPGQTLRIRWTLFMGFRPDANVTLQAAAMTTAGANNPPAVSVLAPNDGSIYAAPASILLEATASDFDGNVERVEFFANNQRLGEDTTSGYTFSWDNVQPGYYLVRAVAYDNGGEASESKPIEVFVHGTGGSLLGSVTDPPSTLDLTAEGTADWAHWGLETSTSYNHKAGVSQQIGNFEPVGENPVRRYSDNYTGYSWNDGTPTPSIPTNSHTGVFVIGENNGFDLALPATTTQRTVKVYVGLYGAQGNFQAYLSDFSAQAYIDTSLNNVFDSSYGVYTLTYAAASPNKVLHIRYRPKLLYDGEFGNVTLQAATLLGAGGTNSPPSVSISNPTNNATFATPANITIQAIASDADGTVTKVEFFNGVNKLGEVTSPDLANPLQYTFHWNGALAGNYVLTARATDDDATSTTSAPVNITIGGSNNAPSVSLTNPMNNAVFTAPANILLQASASDSDGTIAKVEFFNGVNKLGEDTMGEYSYAWTNVPAGTYTLTAKATDDAGAMTTSGNIVVVVRNPLTSLALQNVAVVGPNFHFSFQTQSNWNYSVQFATSLPAANWQTLPTLVGDGSEAVIDHAISGATNRFYRVIAD